MMKLQEVTAFSRILEQMALKIQVYCYLSFCLSIKGDIQKRFILFKEHTDIVFQVTKV